MTPLRDLEMSAACAGFSSTPRRAAPRAI